MPILLATMAVQQKSQRIRFRSGAEMLDRFGMAKGGKEYRRLVGAFERIFGATIFFGTDSRHAKARVVHRSRFNFLREAQIWYNRDLEQAPPSDACANLIVLSDEFYREVTEHPIPTDLDAVKVLSAAPAVLDLFMWLAYRCFVAKGEERFPFAPSRKFNVSSQAARRSQGRHASTRYSSTHSTAAPSLGRVARIVLDFPPALTSIS